MNVGSTEPLRILSVVFTGNSNMNQDDMEHYRCAILSESGKILHRMVLGYLRDSGYHVDIFHDQSSALGSINECGYTLLLVDVDIPGLDVLSLLSQTHLLCPETSMVVMTGNEKMDAAMQALKLGAADILVKPINLFYLDAALEKSVRLSRLMMDHTRALEDMKKTQTGLAELKQRNLQLLRENESLREEIQQLKRIEGTKEQ